MISPVYCVNSMYETLIDLFGEQLVISFECCCEMYYNNISSKNTIRNFAPLSSTITDKLPIHRKDGYTSIHQQLCTQRLRLARKSGLIKKDCTSFSLKVYQIPKYGDKHITFRKVSNVSNVIVTGKKKLKSHLICICNSVSCVWL